MPSRSILFVGAAPTPATSTRPLDTLFQATPPNSGRNTIGSTPSTSNTSGSTHSSNPGGALGKLQEAAAATFKHRLDVKPAAELDKVLNRDVAGGGEAAPQVKRVEGSGPVQLVLFSNGSVLTLSEEPELHGRPVLFPTVCVPLSQAELAVLPAASAARRPTKRVQPRIADAAAGEAHYVAVDVDGRVYTWGWSNAYGQLGRGGTKLFAPNRGLIGYHEPEALRNFGPPPEDGGARRAGNTVIESRVPHKIVAVACGRDHTVLLTESRRCVYVFGRGHRGQLGLKDTVAGAGGDGSSSNGACAVVDFAATPRSVPALFGLPVARISCNSAAHHTLVVLESGHLVAMGENLCGNLGRASCSSAGGSIAHSQPRTGNPARATHPHFTAPTIVDVEQSGLAASAPQIAAATTVPALPRRMRSLVPVERTRPPATGADPASSQIAASAVPVAPPVQVRYADCSAMHTAIVSSDGAVFTAGAPPLRLQNGDQPVSALGPLGRYVTAAAEAATFQPVPEFFVDLAAGDAVVCGAGWTAVLLRRHNTVYVAGAIEARTGSNEVIVGAGAEARSWLQLDLAGRGKVVEILAAGRGLMLVVE